MKETETHDARARALATTDGFRGPPVFRGYLDAVGRLYGDLQGPGRAGTARVERHYREVVWVDDGHVMFALENRDDVEIAGGFTPDQARKRAYELLVLADEAEDAP